MNPDDFDTLLFDLDGTLVDTAADLLGTLDDLRAERGLAPMAHSLPPALAARGGRGILAAGFPHALATELEALLPEYLARYALRIARHSRPYPGVESMLDAAHQRGWKLGIVTNKPEQLAKQLLQALGWEHRFGALIGGDTLAVRKPAPEPVIEACRRLGSTAPRALMIGDDARDIEAGRAAGCQRLIACAYGYVEMPEAMADWGAHLIVDSSLALAELLSAQRP